MNSSRDGETRYVIGIDLGTTNSAVAYVDLQKPSPRQISFLDIPQLISPGRIGIRAVLPSYLYLPGPYELPPGSTALPWDKDRDYSVGEFAREQGALVPGRLVSSAKSWLCHAGVDRTAPILPWGTDGDLRKVSPSEASSRYLQHIRESWNESIGRQEESRLEEQTILLTVPASFDEVARELTVDAASRAGLSRVILLEEPLAAFYAWLSRHEQQWQDLMTEGQLILVCDVGGGTTDFTILAVRRGDKGLRFDRLAVGDHLMLGGDNMDLSLARTIESRLRGPNQRQLDSKTWHQLWHRCRQAKEVLLLPGVKDSGKGSFEINLIGSGGNVIGGMLKATLTAENVEEQILEGFFPFVSPGDLPEAGRRRGLTEWGLPYVQDPAVTRHLASFWRRFVPLLEKETGRAAIFPDFILFNGGALTPPSIRRRLTEVVQQWFQQEAGRGWSLVELENPRPELAVAEGAAYYGLIRRGEGTRVGAGSPRSYYVEVGGGNRAEVRAAVCLVERGTEEGFTGELSQPAFDVVANRPVSFQILSSSTRLGDRMGDLVKLEDEEAVRLPAVRTVLRYGKKGAAQSLPVQLHVHLTEVGTLELWCQARQTPHRWQLQFDVRQEGEPQETLPGETLDANLIDRARQSIHSVFDRGASESPEGLVKELQSILESGKEQWSFLLIRKLADTLLEGRQGRTISFRHESRWFNLAGFCLRPGFGDPLDEWRAREAWKLFPQGLQFPREAQGRAEWWIFWRRIAGGLNAGQQLQLYQSVNPGLQGAAETGKKKGFAKPWRGHEELEIWMMLANLERLPASAKEELGNLLLDRIRKGKPKPQQLWALGRLGARIPFYGPLDRVVASRAAHEWLNAMLSLPVPATPVLAQALVQLSRFTGDRERDIPSKDRDRLAQWIGQLSHTERLRQVLLDPEVSLQKEEQQQIFGDSLPPGLVLSE
jgi:molecular chaperone DnaK (HSP70)